MEKSLYGLLDQFENRFYLVTDNYHLAKQIQFLLIKRRFFFCVNLLGRTVDINEKNCTDYGCSKAIIRNIALDIELNTLYDGYITPAETSRPTDQDLLKNIKMLYKLLNTMNYVFDLFKQNEEKKLDHIVKGLEEFKKFFSTLLIDDPNIESLIDGEISEIHKLSSRLDLCRAEILNILFEIDFYQSHDIVKNIVNEKLEQFQPKETHKTRMLIKNMLKKITQ